MSMTDKPASIYVEDGIRVDADDPTLCGCECLYRHLCTNGNGHRCFLRGTDIKLTRCDVPSYETWGYRNMYKRTPACIAAERAARELESLRDLENAKASGNFDEVWRERESLGAKEGKDDE